MRVTLTLDSAQIQQQLEAAIKGGLTASAPAKAAPAPAPAATVTTTSAPAKKSETASFIESGAPVTAIGQDPYPVKSTNTWYKATLPFRNAPGQSRRRDIRDVRYDDTDPANRT